MQPGWLLVAAKEAKFNFLSKEISVIIKSCELWDCKNGCKTSIRINHVRALSLSHTISLTISFRCISKFSNTRISLALHNEILFKLCDSLLAVFKTQVNQLFRSLIFFCISWKLIYLLALLVERVLLVILCFDQTNKTFSPQVFAMVLNR